MIEDSEIKTVGNQQIIEYKKDGFTSFIKQTEMEDLSKFNSKFDIEEDYKFEKADKLDSNKEKKYKCT